MQPCRNLHLFTELQIQGKIQKPRIVKRLPNWQSPWKNSMSKNMIERLKPHDALLIERENNTTQKRNTYRQYKRIKKDGIIPITSEEVWKDCRHIEKGQDK